MEFNTVLRTTRLSLRCLAPGDADCIYAIRSDPDFAALMNWPSYEALDEAAAYISRVRADPLCLSWALVLRETGETAGAVCLWHIDRIAGRAELGYELRRNLRGGGLMAEACRAVVTYCQAALGLGTVFARPHPENASSARLLERLGFQWTGIEAPTPGDPFSHLIYERTGCPE